MFHPRLVLSPAWRIACIVLQVVPVPGVGAIIAGIKNPHSGLRGRGIAQAALVVFGSWPLIIPGAAGLIWAIVDAVRIGRWAEAAPSWSYPTEDADPDTLTPTRAERQAAKQAERAERKAAKQAARDAEDA